MRTITARALQAQVPTAKGDALAVADVMAAAAAAVALEVVEALDTTMVDPAVTALAVTMALLMRDLTKDLMKDPTAMVLVVTVAHATMVDPEDMAPGASTVLSADHATVAVSADHTQIPAGVQASIPPRSQPAS